MSGLPTAADIIWDLKRQYYAREENQEITRQDMQNDAVQARIQSFMDSRGFPQLWADNEYTTYFEKIFGHDKEFAAIIQQNPNIVDTVYDFRNFM